MDWEEISLQSFSMDETIIPLRLYRLGDRRRLLVLVPQRGQQRARRRKKNAVRH